MEGSLPAQKAVRPRAQLAAPDYSFNTQLLVHAATRPAIHSIGRYRPIRELSSFPFPAPPPRPVQLRMETVV